MLYDGLTIKGHSWLSSLLYCLAGDCLAARSFLCCWAQNFPTGKIPSVFYSIPQSGQRVCSKLFCPFFRRLPKIRPEERSLLQMVHAFILKEWQPVYCHSAIYAVVTWIFATCRFFWCFTIFPKKNSLGKRKQTEHCCCCEFGCVGSESKTFISVTWLYFWSYI